MRLSQICQIAKAKLPQYTDDFSDSILNCTISSSAGSGVISVNSTAHDLSVNDEFTLSNIDVGNDIPSLSDEIINYRHVVTNVIDADNFEFEIVQQFPVFTNLSGRIHKNVRIFVSADINQSNSAYTETRELTLSIIDLPANVSRDRRVRTDANQNTSLRNANNQYLISTIACALYIPLKNQTVGEDAVDKQREVLAYLFKSLSGVQLDSDFENKLSTQLTVESSGVEQVTNSTYVHSYTFQVQEVIALEDQNTDTFEFDASLGEVSIPEPVIINKQGD